MYLPTPLSIKTCLNAPPPPITNRIMAIVTTAFCTPSISCWVLIPQFLPKVKNATHTAKISAISALPIKATTVRSSDSAGKMKVAIDAAPIRITGVKAVSTAVVKLGVLTPVKSRSLCMPFGTSGRKLFSVPEKTGPAKIVAGIAIIIPYKSVFPISAP
ncbi:hypothetical protein D3C78_1541450 [compost metagenome]